MDVSAAVAARRSIRAFLDTPVPEAVLKAAIAAAAAAPSSGNLQPWRLYALAGEPLETLKAQMALATTGPPPEPPQYAVYPKDMDPVLRARLDSLVTGIFAREGVAADRPDQAAAWSRKHFQLFGAPAGLFIYVDKTMGAAQWIDIGAYLQSLLLLLTEQGVSTCLEAAWGLWWPLVDRYLEAPPGAMLVCGVAIGYADPAAPINGLVVPRAPLEDFATFRGFGG